MLHLFSAPYYGNWSMPYRDDASTWQCMAVTPQKITDAIVIALHSLVKLDVQGREREEMKKRTSQQDVPCNMHQNNISSDPARKKDCKIRGCGNMQSTTLMMRAVVRRTQLGCGRTWRSQLHRFRKRHKCKACSSVVTAYRSIDVPIC
jgi:hypothetical protein